MKDITPKPETLRTAIAQAVLRASPEHLILLEERRTEKGDALEAARVAGILAAKRAWELIPLCHPLPLSGAHLDFEFKEDHVMVTSTIRVIASTGVEMEALTSASVAALTLYDMLKPHAGADMSISEVRLLEKTGGKSQYSRTLSTARKAVIIVLSDSVTMGSAQDQSGRRASERLSEAGFEIDDLIVLADEPVELEQTLLSKVKTADLVLTVGGTGISPRDCTVDVVSRLLDRELPGVVETARAYGQRRMPYAMLSRAVAGTIGDTLVLTVPGSVNSVDEYCDALIPGIFHAFDMMRGAKHSHGHKPR